MIESLKRYWWEEPTESVHKPVIGIVKHLAREQSYRKELNLRNIRLYGNMNIMGLSSGTYNQAQSLMNADRLSLNIIQSCCDTATQKICKNLPRPMFTTEGGDYTAQKKAKLLNQFVQGQFYATNFYAKSPVAFKDGTICGDGWLKIFRDGDEIKVERVLTDQLYVDDAESMYGEPRSKYEVRFLPKDTLMKAYPQFATAIKSAPRTDDAFPSHQNLSNMVTVVEAWHLPYKKRKKKSDPCDGRHVIVIEGQTLIDEEYDKDYFPFVGMPWNKRPLGYFSQGIAEQLTGLQVEINKILRTIQLAFHLTGVPKILLDMSSRITKAHLNNEVGGLVWYDGIKPEWIAPTPVAGELFSHLFWLYQRAYEIVGISQLAAQSKKPEGLDSGKALRTYDDIESERFILVGKSWEKLHLDAAKQMIALGKEISEDKDVKGGYKVKVKGRKFLETIDWKEIDLEEDEYIMQCFPTSFMSANPSDRFQDIQDYMQAGFIDKVNGMRLMEMPDLEGFVSLQTASIENLEATIERIIDKGEYEAPEPFQDLATGVKMFQASYLKAKNDHVDEANLELLRRWMEEANSILNPPPDPSAQLQPGAGAAPMPQAPPPGPGMQAAQAQAVPQAQPTSALMPQAGAA